MFVPDPKFVEGLIQQSLDNVQAPKLTPDQLRVVLAIVQEQCIGCQQVLLAERE